MSEQEQQQGRDDAGRDDAGRDEPVGGYGDSTEAEALTGETTPDEATVPARDADADDAKDPNADSA